MNIMHLQDSINVNRDLLIIEDNPADVTCYLRLLENFDHGFNTINSVHRIEDGRKILKDQPPACCLLDNFLPDGNAMDLLESLIEDKNKGGSSCPIIVVTGQEDTATAVELMHKGAQDYLVKQMLDSSQLQKAMHNAIKTWEMQKQINHLALYDSLTGLVN